MYTTPDLQPRALTYQELFTHHQSKHGGTSNWGNMRSALKRFLAAAGKSLDSPIGAEMTGDFAEVREKALEGIGLKDPVRSRIKSWQDSYMELLEAFGMPESFGEALKWAMQRQGIGLKALTQISGVKRSAIYEWSNNRSFPTRQANMGKINNLERALDLPPNTLVAKLPSPRKKGEGQTPWGRQLSERILRTDAYSCFVGELENCPKQIIRFWDEFQYYKTAELLPPGIKRQKNGIWRVNPDGTCPTAEMLKGVAGLLFGFFALGRTNEDPLRCGLGVPSEELCPSMLIDPEKVVAFLNFVKLRSGRSRHSGYSRCVLGLSLSLIHPETGFLLQRRDLVLPRNQRENEEAWRDHCAKAYKYLREAKNNLETKRSRDPWELLAPILDSPQPIAILIEMNEIALERHSKRWGSRLCPYSARSFRDCLLNYMLTFHPLRRKNYSRLTWRADNTGHLRQRDGGWWLSIPAEEFKNEKGAAKEGYSVMVNPHLWPMIDRYLNVYRPILRTGTDRVFLPAWNQPNSKAGVISPQIIGNIVREFTKQFCPVSIPGGFGPQAYRHIVATDILKNNPTMVEVAAAVLHDRPETVRKAYARWLQGDKYAHFHNYMATVVASHVKEDA